MTYAEFDACPAYEGVVWNHWTPDGRANETMNAPGALRWAGDDAPPEVGARILVTINNCGPAIVTGYFSQDGWLGLRCTLTAPPDWHVRQNNGDPKGCVFGPEFRPDTFEAGRAKQRSLERGYAAAGAALQRFPRLANGLTPDEVKAGEEWRRAVDTFNRASLWLRNFNGPFCKRFAAELRAERDARRVADRDWREAGRPMWPEVAR